jgi:diguanylate cyclase (GGDEF)-like protein
MLLNDLGELLQACRTQEEAYQIISSDVRLFFPGCSGAMYVLNNSRSKLERVAAWGDEQVFALFMEPSDCWGLRLGKLHLAQAPQPRTICNHFEHGRGIGSICAPMIAQNEAFGVLSLAADSDRQDFSEARRQLIETVSEQISLGLANLKLRETLQRQAIRDALTELFNYRYMEETLDREIARAERKNHHLGLLMLDIDHFKSFNDEYGHAAGDAVLREMGSLLLSKTRKEDVACRYGGEEFLVIMPDVGENDILARAEELRAAVERLHITHQDRLLRDITVSMGVAVFPVHGRDIATLMKAADTALYEAKREGRNQVCIWNPVEMR